MAVFRSLTFAFALAVTGIAEAAPPPVKVTPDNFVRAESDLFFSRIAGIAGIGKFLHAQNITPIDFQPVVRMNRDTLYSAAVFDLDASPVDITLPDSRGRYQSMQVISQDEYSAPAIYQPGTYTFTKDMVGTRYAFVLVRMLVNPKDPADLAEVHALQKNIRWNQANTGKFEIPVWDPASQTKVRNSLFALAGSICDSRRMFGSREQVDPVRHQIGAAIGWGGGNEKDALYLMRTVPKNDGASIYRVTIKDVPVDGFWSISVYNAQGYFQKNPFDAYSLNNLTAAKNADGSVSIQFGGCDGKIHNCLPTMPGWNYWVRLFLPRQEVLDNRWDFPVPVKM
jgi:hypothetical protein